MQHHLPELVRQCRLPEPERTPELTQALAWLTREIETLAGELQVEYYGPGVGTDPGAEDVYTLVIRPHLWQLGEPRWGLRICDATEGANWRAMWALEGVGRLRGRRVLQVLPVFLGSVHTIRIVTLLPQSGPGKARGEKFSDSK
jgi:hypothetical protein